MEDFKATLERLILKELDKFIGRNIDDNLLREIVDIGKRADVAATLIHDTTLNEECALRIAEEILDNSGVG